jgi:D-3-phosphoglycerate dehydrogenase
MTSGSGSDRLAPIEVAGFDIVFGPPGRHPDRQELLEALPGCVGYLAGTELIDASIIAAADRLRVISRNGAGTDNIDLVAAEQRGIIVMRAPGANARGVAELTLGLIIDATRSVTVADRSMRAGSWARSVGKELPGQRLGIVGYGAIGRIVASLARSLGMSVAVFDPFLDGVASEDAVIVEERLDDLLSQSGIVTLHCPPTGSPLIGQRELSLMPHGSILINTARWSLVDDVAVIAALDRGDLATYATDTYRVEPPSDDAMVAHPRTIVTPHIGGATDESVARAAQAAVDNLLRVLRPVT